jgi:hypothetical protein
VIRPGCSIYVAYSHRIDQARSGRATPRTRQLVCEVLIAILRLLLRGREATGRRAGSAKTRPDVRRADQMLRGIGLPRTILSDLLHDCLCFSCQKLDRSGRQSSRSEVRARGPMGCGLRRIRRMESPPRGGCCKGGHASTRRFLERSCCDAVTRKRRFYFLRQDRRRTMGFDPVRRRRRLLLSRSRVAQNSAAPDPLNRVRSGRLFGLRS